MITLRSGVACFVLACVLQTAVAQTRHVVATPLSSSSQQETGATRNDVLLMQGMRLVDSIQFEGGSEIAADKRFVYANQLDGTTARGQYPDRGGFRLMSASKKALTQHGSLHCPGNDNDIQPIGGSVVVVAHHNNRCNLGHGVMLVDIARPRSPRIIGRVALEGSAHTVTVHPRAPVIYVSPGGFLNGGGEEAIIDVSDPHRPSLVTTFRPNPAGCHDLTMMPRGDETFAFCSGLQETSIWDVSDPLSPSIVGRIHNPAIEFMYVAQPSPDGRYLAVVDEAFVAHECALGTGPGGVWLYDIHQVTAPILVGRIPPPRRGSAALGTADDITSWCAAHGIAWNPEVPELIAVTWYSAGISVFDVSSPVTPDEVAAFQATDSLAEAVVWHRGLLYSNDLRRGVDVFEVDLGQN